ncbi:endonuclease domain-containing 1 protein-like [Pseudonaja textilis]|uniref:endonuclease domain-containing 1 protein-like n=1 Tax=Pseudonaja textilis TaxID=8673 RepID=UPI000EA92EF8|nr:endonuclease domain-containing 1 protein-like [Pseudonaja textilis]
MEVLEKHELLEVCMEVLEEQEFLELALPWDHQCKGMESEQDCGIDPQELAKSQAVLKDYAGVLSYIKGQLAPFSHQPDQDSKDAAFTLTNVVPQFKDLANGYWKQYLSNMRKDADGCGEMYVITGVVPGEDSISESRVNKPSYIWTAVCCVHPSLHKTSWGFIADNTWNNLDRLSLRQLEQNLQVKYGKPINLFNGACYVYN